MPWIMEIEAENPHGKLQWYAVHPATSNAPYQYDTKEDAERMLRIAYPPVMMRGRGTRVREVA